MDGHDVGVVDGGGGSCLLLESLVRSGAPVQVGGDYFQRDLAIESWVIGAEYLAHRSGTEGRADLVPPKPMTGFKTHGRA